MIFLQDETMTRTVTLIPGDTITHELVEPVLRVLDRAGSDVEFERQEAGVDCFRASGCAIPESTLDSIRRNRVALKGKILALPQSSYPSPNAQLRQDLDLFAVVNPIRNLPGLQARHNDIDIVLIRESTEDLYSGMEDVIRDGIVTSMKIVTARACERISRFAFEYARSHGRRKITLIHKSNIMKVTDGLLMRTAGLVAEHYPDIAFDTMIVDNASMQLVLHPHQFDVLLTGNLYGGILTDLGAGIVGGISASMGSSRNEDIAVFEAIHGEAPELEGKEIANPLPLLMPACYLLEHMDQADVAGRIRNAVSAVLEGVVVTPDLGGSSTTTQMTDAITASL